MTTTPHDPLRAAMQQRGGTILNPNRAQGQGRLHATSERTGTYRAKKLPGPNEPCECASGKKAKKCHPEGLKAVVNEVKSGGICDGCGKSAPVLVPLNHEGTGPIGSLGPCCLSGDPKPVYDRLIAKARQAAKDYVARQKRAPHCRHDGGLEAGPFCGRGCRSLEESCMGGPCKVASPGCGPGPLRCSQHETWENDPRCGICDGLNDGSIQPAVSA